MRWHGILAETAHLTASRATNPEITAVTYDSRESAPGSLFVAMRGGTADGNRFVRDAIAAGAVAILTDSRESFAFCEDTNLPVALIEHGRQALAQASATFYGHPERRLALTAVTGTNGKTTTTFLTEALLRSVGRTAVLLGTIETHVAGVVRPTAHTTPESRDILQIFAEGVQAGATEAVMEMSSHALDQERVYGLPVDIAIFTNLTQDHLDYHGSMDRYAAAKARLFTGIGTAPPRVAMLNADDSWFATMRPAAQGCPTVWTYSLEESSTDFYASGIQYRAGHTSFLLQTPYGSAEIASRLTGRVNIYNLIAAIGAALARGLDLDTAVQNAAGLQPVPGRFETVPNTLGLTVVIDYAHTDDALRNLIAIARELAGSDSEKHGRVLTLFGCGGDRDRTKRPKMGRAAGEGSDIVIVTSDNPRSEDPATVAEEAMAGVRETGCRHAFIELDRAAAIAQIIHLAQPGDVVLVAGKGHEKTQTAGGLAMPFDDVAVAAEILRRQEAHATDARRGAVA